MAVVRTAAAGAIAICAGRASRGRAVALAFDRNTATASTSRCVRFFRSSAAAAISSRCSGPPRFSTFATTCGVAPPISARIARRAPPIRRS
ncbi:hypothetical protein WS70_14230 [Burkholderia mayonis]|uniref:Uncharacterized protein n=1 Tax=Burkholderia mayonis TaxID=1385591 RepID=A0A1B4FGQ4_9BURK|nr:hypothetical protein WS70_14230 [Burkholderia mayonis]KVE44275.1 hypothetical protein WS70_07320 [Burkholderia mayonis]KVE44983.1 hypothetical protein WS69_18860 [Burkholderia sp. BDU5]